MEYFGLKLGQDLGNRAAHPYQKFGGVPPPPPPPPPVHTLDVAVLFLRMVLEFPGMIASDSSARISLFDRLTELGNGDFRLIKGAVSWEISRFLAKIH